MIPEVPDCDLSMLRFFFPGRGQRNYEWHSWTELAQAFGRAQQVRDDLLSVDSPVNDEALERAQSLARSVDARLECIATLGICEEGNQDLDGKTRPLRALDIVTLRYTAFPHIPSTAELIELAESNPSFRNEIFALPTDSQDTALCRAKSLCAVSSAKAAAIRAMEELR